MTKYLRSQHVPLEEGEPKVVQKEFEEFISELQDAGEILKTLREKQGWTEAALGRKVDLDAENILLFERGEKPIPVAIAKKLGELFNRDYHLFL